MSEPAVSPPNESWSKKYEVGSMRAEVGVDGNVILYAVHTPALFLKIEAADVQDTTFIMAFVLDYMRMRKQL